MNATRLTNAIYEVDLDGNAVRRRPRRTYLDQIGQVIEMARSIVPEFGSMVI
jgi:hypothetical protein